MRQKERVTADTVRVTTRADAVARTVMSSRITVSKITMDALDRVMDREELDSIDETIQYALQSPMPGNTPVHGRSLSRDVLISEQTKRRLRFIREKGEYEDFDAVIRDGLGLGFASTAGSTNPNVDATLKGSPSR